MRANLLGTLVLAVVGGLLAGCAQASSAPVAQSTAATAAPIATSLPDGIPLLPQSQLAADPQVATGGTASGWSAVAVLPTSTTTADAAAKLAVLLRGQGWTVTSRSVQGAQTIVAQRDIAAGAQWLNVTVTPPVPHAGPAVSYRFASGPKPVMPS